MRTKWTAAVAAGLLLTAAACGGSSSSKKGSSSTGGQTLKGQSITVAGEWTGAEQTAFQKVLSAFTAQTGAKTSYVPTGDDVSTFLGSKLQGGQPPDVAFLPQPGVLQQFAKAGSLKPLSADISSEVSQNYSSIWQNLATVNGKLYGVYFKAANKSTVWYSTKAFTNAGITAPPTTWAGLLKDADTLSASGSTPFAVGGGDGWTLTDWFENVYLSQAGPAMYDKLTTHAIPWTDPSVKTALTTLAQIWGHKGWVAGGSSGALATDFPTSVNDVFAATPKAAMVYEGDFTVTNIQTQTKAKVGTDAKYFPFPAVGGTAPTTGGGDVGVAFKDNPASMAFLKFLATPAAAKVWAEQGGFTSPNKNLDPSVYPDPISKQLAQQVISAGANFRFDMSDQAPAAFGGTKGQGEWKDLQDFLANPSDVNGAAKKLEADAAKDFK
jgi:ABC-type glycerol-3-phosphate transport system substrate-binding protein